jgi:hypothetical protein
VHARIRRKSLLPRDHFDLAVPYRENRTQVINVGKNKVQVSKPACSHQEIDAVATKAGAW